MPARAKTGERDRHTGEAEIVRRQQHTVSPDPTHQRPDRNLALELVRVTEAAALAAAPLVGRGDKEAADQAAVDGMHYMLQSVQMDGVVVIGEGEKDEAPMLANGEQIGDGSPPQVDIAVDPLEGTTLAAHGMPSALAVIALSARGTMFDPGPCVYMEKMAGAPDIADLLDLDRPLGETVEMVAARRGCPVGDVMVVVLDREDLVSGDDVFFSATGITDGDVLQGVRYPSAGGATTESLVTRARTGTIRRILATHDRAKLRAVSGERYSTGTGGA